ncbi:MAG TPA: ABC transporter substrate-binding protein [Thermomicrobiales bacterium]|jgi:multiple sugar transport system substrate-binding protein|nr:ABC transporter substrate-binding protein [Thermomicrobiales bacterium]
MSSRNVLGTRLTRRQVGALGAGAAMLGTIPAARPAAAQDRKKVTVWGEWSGEGEQQIKTMIDLFNESQSEYQAEYVVQQDMITKFLTGATSGQTPDVLVWDRWQTTLYAPRGVLHNIKDRLDADGVSIDDFYAEAVRELSWEDGVYGLPLTVDARALFYNKGHLEEAGVEAPTTWDELLKVAPALTKREGDKLAQAGFSLGDVGLFSMYHRQAGGTMLTEDNSKTSFNNEQGLSVLQLWQNLMDAGVYEVGYEAGLGEGTDAFVTGKVSMVLSGPWSIGTYKKFGKDLDFGVVPPPAGPNGDQGSVMGGFGLAIAEGAKEQDGGWQLVKWWLADAANALTWGKTASNIPGNLAAAQDAFFTDDPHIAPVVETLEFAKIRPPVAGYSPMEVDALIPNLQLFMEGRQSAEDSLKKAQEDGDRVLEENNL